MLSSVLIGLTIASSILNLLFVGALIRRRLALKRRKQFSKNEAPLESPEQPQSPLNIIRVSKQPKLAGNKFKGTYFEGLPLQLTQYRSLSDALPDSPVVNRPYMKWYKSFCRRGSSGDPFYPHETCLNDENEKATDSKQRASSSPRTKSESCRSFEPGAEKIDVIKALKEPELPPLNAVPVALVQ